MKKYLCISATNYNLLLFCLLKDFLGRTVFWVSPNLYSPDQEDFFLLSEAAFSKERKSENERRFHQIEKGYFSEGDFEIYAQDHILPSYSFIRGKFSVIEDGTMSYLEAKQEYEKEKERSFLSRWKRRIKGKIPSCGISSKVDKVYLRGILPTPFCIQHKVEYIDIHSLWRAKTTEEQRWILKFFGFQQRNLKLLQSKKVILFSQPLSEDGIMTEEEKVEIYRKILEKENLKDVIIKAHPREVTEYSRYFVGISILQERTPFELYLFHGLTGKKVITLFSTAVYGLKDFEVIFYGTKEHEVLRERFREIEYKREL